MLLLRSSEWLVEHEIGKSKFPEQKISRPLAGGLYHVPRFAVLNNVRAAGFFFFLVLTAESGFANCCLWDSRTARYRIRRKFRNGVH